MAKRECLPGPRHGMAEILRFSMDDDPGIAIDMPQHQEESASCDDRGNDQPREGTPALALPDELHQECEGQCDPEGAGNDGEGQQDASQPPASGSRGQKRTSQPEPGTGYPQ